MHENKTQYLLWCNILSNHNLLCIFLSKEIQCQSAYVHSTIKLPSLLLVLGSPLQQRVLVDDKREKELQTQTKLLSKNQIKNFRNQKDSNSKLLFFLSYVIKEFILFFGEKYDIFRHILTQRKSALWFQQLSFIHIAEVRITTFFFYSQGII